MIKIATNLTRSWPGKILAFAFICLGYFALGWISLKLATINDNASPIWSPSGFALGSLLLFGVRYAPAVFIGAFLTNATANTDPSGLVIIAFGNMLEAIVGHYFISFMFRWNFLKNYNEFYAVCFGAALSSVVSATNGSLYLYFQNIVPFSELAYTWYTWWSGDTIGILIVLPFFLELMRDKSHRLVTPTRMIFGFILTSLLFFTSYAVFVEGYNLAFAWLLTPILILSGFALGPLLSRAMLICIGAFIVVLTAHGYSPYDYGNLNLNLIYAQSLLTSYAFAILFVRVFDTGFKISQKFIWGNVIAWTGLFIIIYGTFKIEKNNSREDLVRTVNTAIESLHNSINQSELLVNSASSLVSLKPKLTSKEWSSFVESLRLDLRHKEIKGIGIAYYVLKTDQQAFFQDIQKRGSLAKNLVEMDSDYAKKFNDLFVITYVEPANNHFVIGLNLGSEFERRKAAEDARDFNQTIATSHIPLFQKVTKGFLIYNPIHDSEEKFIGWIYAPVDSEMFFSRAFREFSHNLRVNIFHKSDLIFTLDSYPKDLFKNHSFLIRKDVTIFGNQYLLQMYPTAQFFTKHSGYSALLALLMNLFMLFIAAFILEQITFGQRAEKIVAERTHELEESKIQLINSSKMASLGEMASGMAHEINNPLTIILGKIKMINVMMEESKIENPVIQEEMSKMQLGTERIGKIVKGLKSFSRAAGDDPFERVAVDTIIQETLDLCLEKFKAQGIELIIDPIPEISIDCRPSQISQVLLNLLNNAYDAVEVSNKRKWIHLNFQFMGPKMINIAVIDNGKGISPDIVRKVMDPFFTTKEVGKGTGLGLSIAKGIVEDHGGKIWIDEKSLHTRVVVSLPFYQS